MGQKNYANSFKLTLQPHMLELPLRWRQPTQVFVNSMSDLFHKDVSDAYIKEVFDVMSRVPQHKFQVLTKRSERLRELAPQLCWKQHIWMGVSIENEDYLYRINDLRETKARVKFLSLESLLGPLSKLKLHVIDWVIVGGESGPDARSMQSDWVLKIRDQCIRANVPFFFKQWGGPVKSRTGRLLDGRTWDQMPDRKDMGLNRRTHFSILPPESREGAGV